MGRPLIIGCPAFIEKKIIRKQQLSICRSCCSCVPCKHTQVISSYKSNYNGLMAKAVSSQLRCPSESGVCPLPWFYQSGRSLLSLVNNKACICHMTYSKSLRYGVPFCQLKEPCESWLLQFRRIKWAWASGIFFSEQGWAGCPQCQDFSSES